jgi:hypothetical protein
LFVGIEAKMWSKVFARALELARECCGSTTIASLLLLGLYRSTETLLNTETF